jgi:hypothetical protein
MLISELNDQDHSWERDIDGNFAYVNIFDAYENGIPTDAVCIVQGKHGGWRLVVADTPLYSIVHDKTFISEIDAMEEYTGILSGNWFIAKCVNAEKL